jgi:ElaA protein
MDETLRFQWSKFHELSAVQVYRILAVRCAVFIVEQSSAYLDPDGYDFEAEHLTVWSGSEVAAYLRVIAPGLKFQERSIGRIVTAPAFRGTGLGRKLLAQALERLDAAYPGEPQRLGAQVQARGFYERFGFQQASDVYMEDGIPHIEMLRVAPALQP